MSIVSLWLYCHRFGVNSHSVAVIATGYPVAIATPNLMCMLRNTILAPRVQFRVVFKLCLCAASRALLEGPCRFAVDIMSYQCNYNHFESYYSNYSYPWMPGAPPGLGCQQDRPSTLHTGADGGNDRSCSIKTTSHYTVVLKISSPLNQREYHNIHCVILILRSYLQYKSSRKR